VLFGAAFDARTSGVRRTAAAHALSLGRAAPTARVTNRPLEGGVVGGGDVGGGAGGAVVAGAVVAGAGATVGGGGAAVGGGVAGRGATTAAAVVVGEAALEVVALATVVEVPDALLAPVAEPRAGLAVFADPVVPAGEVVSAGVARSSPPPPHAVASRAAHAPAATATLSFPGISTPDDGGRPISVYGGSWTAPRHATMGALDPNDTAYAGGHP
jgi:hypothetical protein